MMVLVISDATYAAALVALDETARRSAALSAPDMVRRFDDAADDLERAFKRYVERQADPTTPVLLKKQAGG